MARCPRTADPRFPGPLRCRDARAHRVHDAPDRMRDRLAGHPATDARGSVSARVCGRAVVTEPLAGFWILVRHALRLDRVRLTVWVLAIAFIPVVTYATYTSLYPTLADRISLGVTLQSNPSFSLLLGPARNLGDAGGYTAWRTIGICAIFVGVMSFLTVVRHTRTDEETGRTELLAAGCVGRFAFLAAGLATAMIACVTTGLAIAVGLVASGADLTGAIAYGVAVTMAGLLFAGAAAIAVQIGSFGRTAISLSIGTLALAYLVRAWGDASSYP